MTSTVTPRATSNARRLLRSTRHPWTAIIFGVVGIIAITVWGLAIKHVTSGISFDVALNKHHNPLFDVLGVGLSDLFSPGPALVMGAILVVVVTRVSRSLSVGLTAGLTTGLSWVSSDIVKYIVDRPRPDYALITHQIGATDVDPSFPSGHVVFISSLTVALLLLLRDSKHRYWVWVPGLVAAVAVSFARMYVGAHYPDDVLSAAIYGIFGSVLVFPILTWIASSTSIVEKTDGLISRWLPPKR